MLPLSALVIIILGSFITVATPRVLFASQLIYFAYCFVWLKPFCHQL